MLRSSLIATALVATAFAGGGAQAATCVGSTSTYVVCEDSRVVYSDCVYLASSSCTNVVVKAPLCVYGGNMNSHFQTVWC